MTIPKADVTFELNPPGEAQPSGKKVVRTRRVTRLLTAVLWAILFVAIPLPAAANGGDLDPSFGGDGTVLTAFTFGVGANAVSLDADGRIVVAGATSNGRGYDRFAVARYRVRGRLDKTFSGDGRVQARFGLSSVANDVAIQPDGKIVVVGGRLFTLNSDLQRFVVARYKRGGAPDETFGGDGSILTRFASSAFGNAVALQPDGKIVVAGYRGGSYALARYEPDGSLDTSFGGDGRVVYRVALGGWPSSVAIQPDGKIVVGGTTYVDAENTDIALLRLRTNGTLDTTFDGDGARTAHLGGVSDRLGEVALQPDGKIVVSASAGDIYGHPRTSHFVVARFLSNGMLDGTFSGNGMVTSDFGSPAYAASILVQGDGAVVAVGDAGRDFGVARFTDDGIPDPAFGSNGQVVISFGDQAGDAVLQPDGKIVVAGTEYLPSDPNRIAVARFLGA